MCTSLASFELPHLYPAGEKILRQVISGEIIGPKVRAESCLSLAPYLDYSFSASYFVAWLTSTYVPSSRYPRLRNLCSPQSQVLYHDVGSQSVCLKCQLKRG